LNTERKRSKCIKTAGEKIVIVDDVIATGGTLKATVDLIKKLGGKIVGISVFIELKDLKGREKLRGYKLHSLIKF
jgi:adenine phosphoribosyltransferase